MKQLNKFLVLLILACCTSILAFSQDEKPEALVTLRYFVVNNNDQYLQVQSRIKLDNKFQPIANATVNLYLDSVAAENLVNTVRTNEKGEAKTSIPFSLKDKWMTSTSHKFIAVTGATKTTLETTTELDIAKAKIVIDTLNEDGLRSVTAQVMTFTDGEWLPAKDVEVKLGVKRLGGALRISDEETFTTDSLGNVSGEFKLDSLPSDDAKKNIILVAKVEDNEQFGNLLIEKTVPWGQHYTYTSNFDKRSLWATRNKTPLWLLFMAYSIIAGVWGVIIYLVFQLIKMKKLGRSSEDPSNKKIELTEEYVAEKIPA
jgi:hypothetical protein